MSAYAWFLLATLSVLWGGSFFFAEIALEQLGPVTIVFSRVLIAAIILLIYVRATSGPIRLDRQTLFALFVMGVLNNAVPFCLIVWGQVYLSGGVASIINAATPLFTVLLAHVLTQDEKMHSNKVVGVVIGIVGVAVLIGPDALAGFGDSLLAQLAIIGATISYALASIYGRRLRQLPASTAAAGMLTGASVALLPLVFIFEKPFALVPNTSVFLALTGLAVLSSAVAYLLYFRILALAGATNLMLVTLLVPVSALVLGVLILDEQIPPTAYIGMTVIFSGLLCIDGRLINFFKRPEKS